MPGGRMTNDRIRELLEQWREQLTELSPLDVEAARLRNKIMYYTEMIAKNEEARAKEAERAKRRELRNSRQYRPLPMLSESMQKLRNMEAE